VTFSRKKFLKFDWRRYTRTVVNIVPHTAE
jgi:hypothetical protein